MDRCRRFRTVNRRRKLWTVNGHWRPSAWSRYRTYRTGDTHFRTSVLQHSHHYHLSPESFIEFLLLPHRLVVSLAAD